MDPMRSVLFENVYLIRELVARDIRSRYVESLIGLFWSVLNPLLLLALYTFVMAGVFGRAGSQESTWALAARIFCGLLPWLALQEGVIRSAQTFLEHGNMIKKLRFPLEVLPFKVVLSAVIHQLIGTVILIVLASAIGELSLLRLVALPIILIVQVAMMYGLGLAVAVLNVFFRDVGQLLGIVFLALFWTTPIIYLRSTPASRIGWVLSFNPFTHMIEAYRWIFLGYQAPSTAGIGFWIAFAVAALIVGRVVLVRCRGDLLDFL